MVEDMAVLTRNASRLLIKCVIFLREEWYSRKFYKGIIYNTNNNTHLYKRREGIGLPANAYQADTQCHSEQ